MAGPARATNILGGPAAGGAPRDDVFLLEPCAVMLRCERERASKHAGVLDREGR